MKKNKIKLLLAYLLGLYLTGLYAQEGVMVTGKDITGQAGSVSYSVGQVVYSTQNGTNGFIIQGAQQPFEISVVSGLETSELIDLKITPYPNPAKEFLILEVSNYEISDVHYRLYDANGKLLRIKNMTGRHTEIAMNNLTTATYFIKIFQGKTELKTFKIVKK